MVEAESQALEGVREAVDSGPKRLARQLLSEGLDVDSVVAQSGLTRPVVLGLSGALKKAAKKLSKSEGEPSDLGKADDEEVNWKGANRARHAQLNNS